MLKTTALALLATCLSACGTVRSSGPVCPSLPEYSKEVQAAAADELNAMPDGSVIANVFMPDYGRMREGVRACLKERDARP